MVSLRNQELNSETCAHFRQSGQHLSAQGTATFPTRLVGLRPRIHSSPVFRPLRVTHRLDFTCNGLP